MTKGTDAAADPKTDDDPYLWLEEIEGERALQWVRAQSAHCLDELESDLRFAAIFERAKRILTAPDRIPYVYYENGWVHNFWQDDVNIRGLLRRTTLESYRTEKPAWETVLDIDQLAEEDGEDWVHSGRDWLQPENDRVMHYLSRGGSDAIEVREFDMHTKSYVQEGFFLPEGKQRAVWFDRDRLLVTTGHGGGGMNTSGYPRTARLWRRGTPIEDSELVYEGPEDDALVYPFVCVRPEGRHAFVARCPDFFTQQIHYVGGDGSATPLPLPREIRLEGVFKGQLVVTLRHDWEIGGAVFRTGSVVSIALDDLLAGEVANVDTVAEPPRNGCIEYASFTADAILITLLEDVTGRIDRVTRRPSGWHAEPVDVPGGGTVNVSAADVFSDFALVNFEGFLTPPTLYAIGVESSPVPLKQLPAQFDSSSYAVEQHFATSADGTRVPYFTLNACDAASDGGSPTVLFGYGGFEASMAPAYVGPYAQTWLENGGAWVVANIRGGGEYGPDWHTAALKENRQRAFDDFIAVAEDLVARGVTSPRRLGIYGGSNGGLLVGAVMVQRPDLFHAVACAVPLLDMLRYHKLLAGASWIGEYGDPNIPAERAYIEEYSPYQNVRADADYPKVLFFTSTKDDRVHPGHARKMAAKMVEQGHEVLYYENVDGGHASAADQIERVRRAGQLAVFSLRELKD